MKTSCLQGAYPLKWSKIYKKNLQFSVTAHMILWMHKAKSSYALDRVVQGPTEENDNWIVTEKISHLVENV